MELINQSPILLRHYFKGQIKYFKKCAYKERKSLLWYMTRGCDMDHIWTQNTKISLYEGTASMLFDNLDAFVESCLEQDKK